MKKFVGMFLTMVMLLIAATGLANEEHSWDLKDYIMYKIITDQYVTAFEEGETFDNCSWAYMYKGVIYWSNVGTMYGVEYGIESNDSAIVIEQKVRQVLIGDGLENPKVTVMFVGRDWNGENLYDVEIKAKENLNEFEGEVSGTGYMQDDFVYYGIRGIVYIK